MHLSTLHSRSKTRFLLLHFTIIHRGLASSLMFSREGMKIGRDVGHLLSSDGTLFRDH
jgi:hypothetical protein